MRSSWLNTEIADEILFVRRHARYAERMSRYTCDFNAPATRQRIKRLLGHLAVTQGSRVLDVGCGRGEMLRMLAQRTSCRGVGVDPDETELVVARQRTATELQLEWLTADIADCRFDEVFDAAICVGATHAFGPPGEGLLRTLEALPRLVRTGGRIMVGEGYWRREPPAEYLDATPFEKSHLLTHAENEDLGENCGWTLVRSEESSQDEWDLFESSFLTEAEKRFEANREDEEAFAVVQHWRTWNRTYLRWGRSTLGFGFYVFELRKQANHAV